MQLTESRSASRKRIIGRKPMMFGMAMIVAIISCSSLMAQRMPMDTAAMRKRQEEMLQKMKSDLKMNDQQSDSVAAISKEFQGKMRAIFMDESVSREDRRAKMQPLRDEQNTRLKAALGDDMYAKYTDWMEKNRPQRGGGGGGMRGGGGGGN